MTHEQAIALSAAYGETPHLIGEVCQIRSGKWAVRVHNLATKAQPFWAKPSKRALALLGA